MKVVLFAEEIIENLLRVGVGLYFWHSLFYESFFVDNIRASDYAERRFTVKLFLLPDVEALIASRATSESRTKGREYFSANFS